MSKDITVVTVSYNAEKYIEETIRSVISQENINYEYIIRDGNSTDKTLSIIEKYKDKIDLLQVEKDFNHFDAMNKSSFFAKGKYIIYMHADDKFYDNRSLFKLYHNLKSSKNLWACGFQKLINSEGKIIKVDELKKFKLRNMLMANQIRHQTSLVPTENMRKIKFDLKYKFAADYLFFLNLWDLLGPPKIICDHLVLQRMDGNNISSNFEIMLLDEFKARIFFRLKKRNFFRLLFYDLIIFALRYLKIKLFHNITFKKS